MAVVAGDSCRTTLKRDGAAYLRKWGLLSEQVLERLLETLVLVCLTRVPGITLQSPAKPGMDVRQESPRVPTRVPIPAVDNPLATHTKLWALAVSDEGNKDNLNAE